VSNHSVIEPGEVEPARARRIGEQVDLDDRPWVTVKPANSLLPRADQDESDR